MKKKTAVYVKRLKEILKEAKGAKRMKPAFTDKQASKMFQAIQEMEAALEDWIMIKKRKLKFMKTKTDDSVVGVWATVKQVRDVREAFKGMKKVRKALM